MVIVYEYYYNSDLNPATRLTLRNFCHKIT